MKYINTNRSQTSASFVQVEPTFGGQDAHINVTNTRPKIGGTTLNMVKGAVRLVKPTPVDVCQDSCGVSVNSQVELRFNAVRGDVTTVKAMRTEVNRLFDALVADFHVVDGVVPPSTATFED